LVKLDKKAAVTESIKHPGKEIRESISRTTKEWQKHSR
jgi:hypothetical protein